MHIGINGLFLRKPGTGIGTVTAGFLCALVENGQGHTYTIYVDEESSLNSISAAHFTYRFIRPWWRRDDLIRKLLWEYVQLPLAVESDFVKHFLSLYQSPSLFTKKVKHTMLVHDLIPEVFPEYQGNGRQRLLWKLTKQSICKADAIVAISESTKRDIVKYLHVEEQKIQVAYPSVATRFFSDSLTGNAYGQKPGYLYAGGGLEKRKNITALLDAYQALVNEDNQTPMLVVSGFLHNQNNSLATAVPSEIEKRGLDSKVHFLGFVPEEHLPGLYQDAVLFVFPSLYEGFGLPVLESLAVGTPVMALKNSSLPEVGGTEVFWVNTMSKESLLTSIQKAKDETPEARLRHKAWAASFTWDSFTEKIIRVVV
jgi:glycosyltransferase involved in cell wall biosynthesis